MMSPHTVVLAAALVALLCLSCAGFAALRSDGAAIRRAWARQGRRDRPVLRVLDRGLAGAVVERAAAGCGCGVAGVGGGAGFPGVVFPGAKSSGVASPGEDVGGGADVARGADVTGSVHFAGGLDGLPAIEQVVAELRRLYRMRCGGGLARDSRLWSAAVESAYDRWLQVACHYLSVSHHLHCLTDMDRDIERVRVEGELAAAGLTIRG
jgi:hypothetical protein